MTPTSTSEKFVDRSRVIYRCLVVDGGEGDAARWIRSTTAFSPNHGTLKKAQETCMTAALVFSTADHEEPSILSACLVLVWSLMESEALEQPEGKTQEGR
ncbi:hypothetical protein MGYG_02795 [Nannizzia gypsea CBS 118893]|uniref:Uncharacterized protein n=1 Tax=Arthroderma gypseum (strain ATCC MYA-4604 / CBS 118893) TaxID=535722 RepID=E4UP29_ARTGP|nr:hypothetical protein MGYG_02795 [Nannizzia gypsea CBS 118893]EFQ99782.1 hypothetical protein MGYG_02795 [Nannizzia gypsea CBS 118893]